MIKLRLTEAQIDQLKNDPTIQATIEANKTIEAQREKGKREAELMLQVIEMDTKVKEVIGTSICP